jgi:hypothetical protein
MGFMPIFFPNVDLGLDLLSDAAKDVSGGHVQRDISYSHDRACPPLPFKDCLKFALV